MFTDQPNVKAKFSIFEGVIGLGCEENWEGISFIDFIYKS